MVTWDISPGFTGTHPYTFRLYASRSGVGDWQLIDTVVDTYNAIDPARWVYGVSPRLTYFVELEDGAGSRYPSPVALATGGLEGSNVFKAREIIRNEARLLQPDLSGICGYLWKRRHYGDVCTCVDHDTLLPGNPRHNLCYGTGIIGGYFNAVPYNVMPRTPSRKRRIRSTDAGPDERQALIGRGLLCPRLDKGDVWCNSNTDEHYIVQEVSELLLAGVPILYDQIELRLVASTDVVYTLPRPGEETYLAGANYRAIQGVLYLLDSTGDYTPIALENNGLVLLDGDTTLANYRMAQDTLFLWDIALEAFYPVGLSDGALAVYAPDARPRYGVIGGYLSLWDDTDGEFRPIGLVDGAFSILEAV